MLDRPWYRNPGWISIVIGLFASCLYIPTLWYGFVNLDDPWLIQNNRTLQTWSWKHWFSIWFDLSQTTRLRLGGEYLPVRDVSVLLDYTLFSPWIGGFHLTQIVLYGLLCGAFAWVLCTWLGSPGLAWIAGTLYAVHPFHVEAVTWLSERKGLLSGVFLMFATVAFHRFVSQGNWWFWGLSLFLLVAGIWSKAVTIAGVGWLAVLLWLFPPWKQAQTESTRFFPNRRNFGEESKTNSPHHDERQENNSAPDHTSSHILGHMPTEIRSRAWLGWFLLALVSGLAFFPVWLAGQRVHMVQGYHGGTWLNTLWLMGHVHLNYLQQAFWAFPHAVKYPISADTIEPWRAILGLFAAGCLGFLAIFGLFHRRWCWFSLTAWTWLLFLVPVSQLIFPLQNIMADRYMLLPSMGFVVAIALGLHFFQQRWAWIVVWVFLLALSAILTWKQTQTWASSRSLYEHACFVHPGWVNGMMQLAHLEASQGRVKRAMLWVQRAKQIDPFHPKIAVRESLLWLQQGQRDKAIAVLLRSASTHRDDKVRANLALLLQQSGRSQEAYRWAKEAVSIRSLIAHNQRVLGVIALELKQWEVAKAALHRAYQLEPHRRQNLVNLGVFYQQQGNSVQAQFYFSRAKQFMR